MENAQYIPSAPPAEPPAPAAEAPRSIPEAPEAPEGQNGSWFEAPTIPERGWFDPASLGGEEAGPAEPAPSFHAPTTASMPIIAPENGSVTRRGRRAAVPTQREELPAPRTRREAREREEALERMRAEQNGHAEPHEEAVGESH